MSRPPSYSLETVYHSGAVFQLYTQQPPTLPKEHPLLTLDGIELENTRGRLYNCHRHNVPIPPNAYPALSVTLSSPLSVGIRGRPTQIWKVSSGANANGSHSEPTLIARFYDPYYYEDPDGLIDPFIAIDRSTATEPESYRRLEPVQGSLVPKFHGLFLCSIPNQARNVYVVLLDYIPGVDLASLDSSALCTDHKNAIIDKVLEVFYRLRSLGVRHGDVAPRNFILRQSGVAGAPVAGREYCASTTCPLRSTVDVQSNPIAVIDIESVDLEEPNPDWYTKEREDRLEKDRQSMKDWLDG